MLKAPPLATEDRRKRQKRFSNGGLAEVSCQIQLPFALTAFICYFDNLWIMKLTLNPKSLNRKQQAWPLPAQGETAPLSSLSSGSQLSDRGEPLRKQVPNQKLPIS